jgi:hypothetical protein
VSGLARVRCTRNWQSARTAAVPQADESPGGGLSPTCPLGSAGRADGVWARVMWRWCGDEPATDLLAWHESPGLYEVVHDDEHEQLELGPTDVCSAAPPSSESLGCRHVQRTCGRGRRRSTAQRVPAVVTRPDASWRRLAVGRRGPRRPWPRAFASAVCGPSSTRDMGAGGPALWWVRDRAGRRVSGAGPPRLPTGGRCPLSSGLEGGSNSLPARLARLAGSRRCASQPQAGETVTPTGGRAKGFAPEVPARQLWALGRASVDRSPLGVAGLWTARGWPVAPRPAGHKVGSSPRATQVPQLRPRPRRRAARARAPARVLGRPSVGKQEARCEVSRAASGRRVDDAMREARSCAPKRPPSASMRAARHAWRAFRLRRAVSAGGLRWRPHGFPSGMLQMFRSSETCRRRKWQRG